MGKKILAICAALIALAAVPAVASASPELLTSAGAKVALGAALKGTSIGNIVLTSSFGNLACSASSLEGKVSENSGVSVKSNIEKASFTGTGPSGRCTSTIFGISSFQVTVENLPWCLTTTVLGAFHINAGTCPGSAIGIRITLHLFNSSGSSVGSCTLERQAAEGGVTGTYNHGTSPLETVITGGNTLTRVAGATICPSMVTLDAKIKFQTIAGGELKVV